MSDSVSFILRAFWNRNSVKKKKRYWTGCEDNEKLNSSDLELYVHFSYCQITPSIPFCYQFKIDSEPFYSWNFELSSTSNLWNVVLLADRHLSKLASSLRCGIFVSTLPANRRPQQTGSTGCAVHQWGQHPVRLWHWTGWARIPLLSHQEEVCGRSVILFVTCQGKANRNYHCHLCHPVDQTFLNRCFKLLGFPQCK